MHFRPQTYASVIALTFTSDRWQLPPLAENPHTTCHNHPLDPTMGPKDDLKAFRNLRYIWESKKGVSALNRG